MAGCEVITLDQASGESFEERKKILRWVSRHLASDSDVLQTAADVAGTEKIIVASPESRYTVLEIASLCSLLEHCEVVEPEEFVHPLPWWGAVDAGQILLQRGLDQPGAGGRTFAFRRSSWRPLRGLEERVAENPIRRATFLSAANRRKSSRSGRAFTRVKQSRIPRWRRTPPFWPVSFLCFSSSAWPAGSSWPAAMPASSPSRRCWSRYAAALAQRDISRGRHACSRRWQSWSAR